MTRRRYELTETEWEIIEPLLPNKPRGVPRVDDRRVINGILWRFRTGSPWADAPERYGPSTTCYNRFVRWRKAGVWDRILADITDAEIANLMAWSVQQVSEIRRRYVDGAAIVVALGKRLANKDVNSSVN